MTSALWEIPLPRQSPNMSKMRVGFLSHSVGPWRQLIFKAAHDTPAYAFYNVADVNIIANVDLSVMRLSLLAAYLIVRHLERVQSVAYSWTNGHL